MADHAGKAGALREKTIGEDFEFEFSLQVPSFQHLN
jgi:hypothetical protein